MSKKAKKSAVETRTPPVKEGVRREGGAAAPPLGVMPPARRLAVAACAILLLTLLAYSNSFNAAFHFDDFHQIVNNQHIRKLGNVPIFFTHGELATYTVGVTGYRPIVLSTLALNYALGTYDVHGYHLFNFLLHVLNSFMVFLLAGFVLRRAGRPDPFALPLLSALIFALHPVNTAAVTYITGRSALLAGFFYLASFLCFAHYRARGGAKGRYVLAALSPALFLMGLLSKEIAISLPAVIIVYDLIFTYPDMEKKSRLGTALYYAPFLAAAVLFIFVRAALTGDATVPDSRLSSPGYLIAEAHVFLYYVRLIFLPFNQDADYALPPDTSFGPSVIFSIALVASVLYLLYRARRKAPEVTFFGLWFFLALAPESSLIPIPDVMVEYRLYLPGIGFIAALIALVPARPLANGYLKPALSAFVLAVFCVLTFNRNAVWATELSLWRDVAKKSPWSLRAHANLGLALINVGDYKAAVDELRLSLDGPDNPDRGTIYNNLGLSYENLGMRDEAIESYRKAIEADPKIVEASENLGAIYIRAGRYEDAVPVLENAVRTDPGYTWTHYNLAGAYTKLGRQRDALREAEAAYDSSPREFTVVYLLAAVCKDNRMKLEALGYARQSASLAGNPQQARNAEALLDELK